MLIKYLKNCKEIIAGDKTILRELLHGEKENLELKYSLAHATLKPNDKSLPHKLKTSEVYYILSGEGRMHIDNEVTDIFPEATVYIPPYSTQWIENIGNENLIFICIVDPAWKKEDEIVLE